MYAAGYREYLDQDSIHAVSGDSIHTATTLLMENAAVYSGKHPPISKIVVNRIAVLFGHERVGYVYHWLNGGGMMRNGQLVVSAPSPYGNLPAVPE